jgi:hypothetical protein
MRVASRAFGIVILIIGLLLVTVLKSTFHEMLFVGITALGVLAAVAAILIGIFVLLPRAEKVTRS